MASLLPSDVQLPLPVANTITSLITFKSAFIASAAAGTDLDAGAQMGGNYFTRGRYNFDSVAAEVIDGSASTPGHVGSYGDIAPILRRKRVRGTVDGTEAAMGNMLSINPSQELMNQSATYWAKQIDDVFVAMLTSFFDNSTGALKDTHRSAIGVASGSAVPISFNSSVDAGTLLGDNFTDLAVLVVHSKVWANLCKEVGAKATYIAIGSTMVPFYDGKRVVISDQVPTTSTGAFEKYTSIMLRPGALFVAVQQAMREIIEINATVPEVRIAQTLHFATGATGMKYVGAANPANTVVDDAGSWQKATAVDKEIGIVALVTNAN